MTTGMTVGGGSVLGCRSLVWVFVAVARQVNGSGGDDEVWVLIVAVRS